MDPETARASATLARLQLVVIAGWAVFLVQSVALGGRPRTVGVQVGVITLTAGMWLLGRRRPDAWRWLMHGTAAVSCVALLLNAWQSGAVLAVAWWYLSVAPLFTSYVGGQRAGWVWAGIAAVGVALACLLDPLSDEFVPEPLDRLMAGVVLVFVNASFGLLSRSVADAQVEEVVAASRARGELLATIGHEVRTPLHGMLGTATLLADTELGPEQREMIETLRASGKALKQIVDDVLDVARLEAGQLRIEPYEVDLLAVIEDVVDLFGPDAAAKNLTLVATVEGAEHLRVEADGNRVRQILANLVGNAVKFTTEGHVAVRVTAREDGERSSIAVAVEDTGPGIPPETLSSLFEAFEQPDARLARIHGGSGLGLSLARHLAERMGGTLTAVPDRQVGARFELALVMPRRPASRRPLLPSPVLLLQRDPLHAEAFLSTAAALGVRAEVAPTLEEARASVVAERPFVTLISGSSEPDPEASRAVLRSALGADRPIVLAVPHDQVGAYLGTEIARSFDGTTLEPLRRSRLRSLLDEASLAQASQPTPLLLGKAVVIDDDATSRRLMEVMLERRGFVVAPFARGAEALEELAKDRFEMVMCDLNMPTMDGIEVVTRARALPTTEDTVFVVASASARDEDRRRCIEAGFSAYLTKPFEPAQLDEVIARARRRASQVSVELRDDPLPVEDEEPSIDLEAVERMRELLGEETDELLRELWDNATSLIERLERAPDDTKEAQRAAHTIASGALQAGLRALGERARALELAVEERSPAEIRAEAGVLRELLAQSFRELGVSPSGDDEEGVERRLARVRFVGHLDRLAVDRELARATRAAEGSASLLVDCSAMSSYDPDARKGFEEWVDAHDVTAIAFVTRNRLWGAVVRAMGTESGTPMRAFWSVSEAEGWLGDESS